MISLPLADAIEEFEGTESALFEHLMNSEVVFKKASMVMAEEIFETTRSFRHEAKHLGLSPNLIKEIDKGMVEKFKAL